MRQEIQLNQPFSKVRCRDIGTLILTQGDQPSLTVEADEELLAKLVAEVRGDSLFLGLDEDWFAQFGKMFSSIFTEPDRKITYYLTVTDLDQIHISGKMDLACDTFKARDLKLQISGLGQLSFGHLECTNLKVSISGRGEFSGAGWAEHQSIHISGSGEYKTPHLASQTAQIVISGQGNATLQVEESLDITISGMGKVHYYGQPKMRQVISGMGRTKRLNDQ